jgi:uncharacterized MAPEG superfamily protein
VIRTRIGAIRNEATAAASATNFWARRAHLLVYTFGITSLRTLALVIGFACQIVLAWRILA